MNEKKSFSNESNNKTVSSNSLDLNSSASKKTNENFKFRKKNFRDFKKKRNFLSKEVERKRRTKVTKGGRRFTVSSLVLFKDEDNKALGFGYSKGKEPIIAFRKSLKLAQRKSLIYFPEDIRTIYRDMNFKYKGIKILIKPTPPGSGLRAGGVLRELFTILGIKDVTAKIISKSKNKNAIVQASFMIFDKLTGKKYDY